MAKRPKLRLVPRTTPPSFSVGEIRVADDVTEAEQHAAGANVYRTLRRLLGENPAGHPIDPTDLKAKSPEAGS